MADHDAVLVGSGINSLACAALLARAGWDVCMLERSGHLGGAIQTAELTEPGFLHDVFSAWHPLWLGGAAHAELGEELAARGLEYLNTDYPTATLSPDGEAAFLLRSADANAEELDRHAAGDGAAWRRVLGDFFPNADLAFGVLGTELWSRDGFALGAWFRQQRQCVPQRQIRHACRLCFKLGPVLGQAHVALGGSFGYAWAVRRQPR